MIGGHPKTREGFVTSILSFRLSSSMKREDCHKDLQNSILSASAIVLARSILFPMASKRLVEDCEVRACERAHTVASDSRPQV